MSDLYDADDFDGNESKLVKDLRAALKAANKAKEAAETESATLKGSHRKRSLEEVLTSKGVNPKVATFIPSDVEGDEAVAKWLDDYADVFGIKVPETDTAPAGMSDADQNALRQAQQLSGQPLSLDKYEEQKRAIQNAQTPEELAAVIKQYGS